MLDIQVDLSPLLSGLSEEEIQALLSDIADSARNHWIKLAQEEFTSTASDYVNAIQPVDLKPGVAVLSLVGTLPNLLEKGMEEKDLRDTLLGPNVPVSSPGTRGKRLSIHPDGSVGYYRAIPFRHSVPGAVGVAAPPMGSAYKKVVADAKKLGAEVYGKAKKLKATKSTPDGGVKYGGRLPAGLAPLLKAHHKSDIYAGMIKEQKTYHSATQGQYMTFRTISTRVTDGWIRKATPARNLAEKVSQFVSTIAPQALQAYVGSLK